jgi:hypothetical protein
MLFCGIAPNPANNTNFPTKSFIIFFSTKWP